jgi:hypothetical protein
VQNDVDDDILIPRTRPSKEEKGGESVSENVAVNDFLVLRRVCDDLCLCLGPMFQIYFQTICELPPSPRRSCL